MRVRRWIGALIAVAMCATPSVLAACLSACAGSDTGRHTMAAAIDAPEAMAHLHHSATPEQIAPTAHLGAPCADCCGDPADQDLSAAPPAPASRLCRVAPVAVTTIAGRFIAAGPLVAPPLLAVTRPPLPPLVAPLVLRI